ncbi:hypothetical protein P3T21_004992 [Paraburkholderia sp. GAS334]
MIDDSLTVRNARLSARQRWTIFVASTGGALEVFDFAVYGFFAQSIGREFFPARTGLPAETLAFAVLAVGSMSRLVGGIFLGRLGDKYGRRIVFTSSAMVAAVSTLLIGILPSYESLGMTAPTLLVLLRLTQGLCLGGELPGAVIYAVETAHAKPEVLCGMVPRERATAHVATSRSVFMLTDSSKVMRTRSTDGWPQWRFRTTSRAASRSWRSPHVAIGPLKSLSTQYEEIVNLHGPAHTRGGRCNRGTPSATACNAFKGTLSSCESSRVLLSGRDRRLNQRAQRGQALGQYTCRVIPFSTVVNRRIARSPAGH